MSFLDARGHIIRKVRGDNEGPESCKGTRKSAKSKINIHADVPKEPLEVMDPVAISLSGGVDSMVICKVLCQLYKIGRLSGPVVAIHLDYANRPESGDEADGVQRWCEGLGAIFYKRVITEGTYLFL